MNSTIVLPGSAHLAVALLSWCIATARVVSIVKAVRRGQ